MRRGTPGETPSRPGPAYSPAAERLQFPAAFAARGLLGAVAALAAPARLRTPAGERSGSLSWGAVGGRRRCARRRRRRRRPCRRAPPGPWGRQPGPPRGGSDRGNPRRPGCQSPPARPRPGPRGSGGRPAPGTSEAAAARLVAVAAAAAAEAGGGGAAAQCGTRPGARRTMRGGRAAAAPSSPQTPVAAAAEAAAAAAAAAAAVVHGAREHLGQLAATESAPRWVHSGAPASPGTPIPGGPCCGTQIFRRIPSRSAQPRSRARSAGEGSVWAPLRLKLLGPLSAPPDPSEGSPRSALVRLKSQGRSVASAPGDPCPTDLRGRKPGQRVKPAEENHVLVGSKGQEENPVIYPGEALPRVFSLLILT